LSILYKGGKNAKTNTDINTNALCGDKVC